jgi:uncharacterized membrane-anchored protein
MTSFLSNLKKGRIQVRHKSQKGVEVKYKHRTLLFTLGGLLYVVSGLVYFLASVWALCRAAEIANAYGGTVAVAITMIAGFALFVIGIGVLVKFFSAIVYRISTPEELEAAGAAMNDGGF